MRLKEGLGRFDEIGPCSTLSIDGDTPLDPKLTAVDSKVVPCSWIGWAKIMYVIFNGRTHGRFIKIASGHGTTRLRLSELSDFLGGSFLPIATPTTSSFLLHFSQSDFVISGSSWKCDSAINSFYRGIERILDLLAKRQNTQYHKAQLFGLDTLAIRYALYTLTQPFSSHAQSCSFLNSPPSFLYRESEREGHFSISCNSIDHPRKTSRRFFNIPNGYEIYLDSDNACQQTSNRTNNQIQLPNRRGKKRSTKRFRQSSKNRFIHIPLLSFRLGLFPVYYTRFTNQTENSPGLKLYRRHSKPTSYTMSSDEPPTSAQVDPPPVPQQLPTTDTVPEKTVDGQDGDGITKKDFATTADGPDRPEDNSGKVDKDYAPPSLLVHASTNISSISDGFSESRSTQGTPTSSSNGSPHVPKPVGLPESSKLPTGATSVPQTPSTVGTKRTSSGAVKLSGGSSSLPNSPTSEQVSTTVPESLNGVTSTPANPDRIQDVCHAVLCFFSK